MDKVINLPVPLLISCIESGSIAQLKVLCAAKLVSPGFISVNDNSFKQLCNLVQKKKRTTLLHLKKLVEMGWVGHDPKTKVYYIRSWSWISSQGAITERNIIKVSSRDVQQFRVFAAAVVMTDSINRQRHVARLNKRRLTTFARYNTIQIGDDIKVVRSVAWISRIATHQDLTPYLLQYDPSINYLGMSNHSLALKLNCSETYASMQKKACFKAGYVKVEKIFLEQMSFLKPDYSIRKKYYCVNEEEAKKMRFISYEKDGIRVIGMVKQLRDKIETTLRFCRNRH